MAAPDSWDSIRKHGLLSTSRLLDLFEVPAEDRYSIERQRRSANVILEHPIHGRAVVRDQKPLNEKKLQRCLNDDTTPEEWYTILNAKVFFWLDPERLKGLREARAYRDNPQTYLTLDTRLVVEAPEAQINSLT